MCIVCRIFDSTLGTEGFAASEITSRDLPESAGSFLRHTSGLSNTVFLAGSDSGFGANPAPGTDGVVHGETDTGAGPNYPMGISDSASAGFSQLLAQTFSGGVYSFSGNRDVDAALIGSRWTVTNQTFSFPSAANQVTDYPVAKEPSGIFQFNATQQDAIRYALGLVAQYTPLTFTEIAASATAPYATHRFANTSWSGVPSAYGNFPSDNTVAGDSWFGNTGQPFYSTPQVGNWGMATIMHEIGHTLGLKHGHSSYTAVNLATDLYVAGPRFGSQAITPERDGQAWSLMTYRTAPGIATSVFGGEGFNQPQTFMQLDIAALQYMYGANYTTNASDTTYTFNPTTGQMVVNGAGQVAPTGNKILRTIWDGGGVDTYDLSNYGAAAVNINLRPGQFSTFSPAQLVNHTAYTGAINLAPGNVANALLVNEDARALIENAIGANGSDRLIGNRTTNMLSGGQGVDTLAGLGGNDSLFGGQDADLLFGDSLVPTATGVGFGSGGVAKTGTPNSIATAINVSNLFALTLNPSITQSTTAPHVTISGSGNAATDFYAFTVSRSTLVQIDVDSSGVSGSFNTDIELQNSAGTVLAVNDDSVLDSGSLTTNDSFISYLLPSAGTYYVRMGSFVAGAAIANIANGAGYRVHISVGVNEFVEVDGVAGNDTIDGGDGDDTLFGSFGADVLLGNFGLDRIDGEQDNDTIYGWFGNDTLLGGEGADQIDGEQDNDVIFGSPGNDTLFGADGDDTLDGEQDDDLLLGGSGNDFLLANIGNDLVFGEVGVDTVYGWLGNDTIHGGSDNDILDGEQDDDLMFGGFGMDLLLGNVGSDRLDGEQDNDTMYGWFGFDTLFGADGDDRLDGEQDNDFLWGGPGNDQLFGGEGNDEHIGEAGNDTMFGFTGNDTLIGGANNDVMGGEAGQDLYIISAGDGADEIIGFEAGAGVGDVLRLLGVPSITNLTQAVAAMTVFGGNVVLNTGGGNSITFVGIGSSGAFAANDFLFV